MKFTRKLFGICAIFIMLFTIVPTNASAKANYEEIPIYLEGRNINANALLIDEITYVPLRKLSESAKDCEITYNARTRTANVSYEEKSMSVTTGNEYIEANGRYFYTIGKIMNIDGSLYVPIRPLAKALELDLKWNSATRSVSLTKSGKSLVSGSKFYNSDEVFWLARIIEAEAGGEIFKGKMAVGNVVLTRVAHRDYPNTIYEVIFDFRHGIQFTPAISGTIYNNPSQKSIIAAKMCLEGYEVVPGALFFFNPRIATSNWISKNRPFAARIGLHDFYY